MPGDYTNLHEVEGAVWWVVLGMTDPPRFMLARVDRINWSKVNASPLIIVIEEFLETPGYPVDDRHLRATVLKLSQENNGL